MWPGRIFSSYRRLLSSSQSGPIFIKSLYDIIVVEPLFYNRQDQNMIRKIEVRGIEAQVRDGQVEILREELQGCPWYKPNSNTDVVRFDWREHADPQILAASVELAHQGMQEAREERDQVFSETQEFGPEL